LLILTEEMELGQMAWAREKQGQRLNRFVFRRGVSFYFAQVFKLLTVRKLANTEREGTEGGVWNRGCSGENGIEGA